jgi:hypothetical protein
MVYKPFGDDYDILKTDSSEDINPLPFESHKQPIRQPSPPFAQKEEEKSRDLQYDDLEMSQEEDGENLQSRNISYEEREELIKKTDSDNENLLTPRNMSKQDRGSENPNVAEDLKNYIESADKKHREDKGQRDELVVSDEPTFDRNEKGLGGPSQESQEPDGRVVNFQSESYQIEEGKEQQPTSSEPISKPDDSDEPVQQPDDVPVLQPDDVDDEVLEPEDLIQERVDAIAVHENYKDEPHNSEREELSDNQDHGELASEGET